VYLLGDSQHGLIGVSEVYSVDNTGWRNSVFPEKRLKFGCRAAMKMAAAMVEYVF
jgi:hypothetical protein